MRSRGAIVSRKVNSTSADDRRLFRQQMAYVIPLTSTKPSARARPFQPRSEPLNATDRALFRAAVADVRPLLADERVRPAVPQPQPQRQKHWIAAPIPSDSFSDGAEIAALQSDDKLWFCRDGLQRRVLQKLRRGQYAIAADLDLHGLTTSEARPMLAAFLQICRRQQLHCVRIIHGKGHRSSEQLPVLKRYVNHWLQQHDEVLAFCSARPVDGGSGALYLLLRRS